MDGAAPAGLAPADPPAGESPPPDLAAERRERLISQFRRGVAHIRDGGTDLAPEPMRNPNSAYLSPERHAREIQVLFRKRPILGCFSSDLPGPGAYQTLDIAGMPVLIARGRDGVARAFLNACRHRGAIVAQGCGAAKLFTCPFHGWSFDCEGRLTAIPNPAAFEGLDRDAHGLVELGAQEKYGIVWIQAKAGGAFDIDDALEGMGPHLAIWRFALAQRIAQSEIRADCNWKIALDTYGEGYHFATLHPHTIAPVSIPDMAAVDFWGPNHRVYFPAQHSRSLCAQPEAEWDLEAHLSHVHHIFPNVQILVTPSGYSVFQLFPGDTPGRMVTVLTTYARQAVQSEAERAALTDNHERIRAIVAGEDYRVAETIQRGLAANPHGHVVYGRNEPTLQNQHRYFAALAGQTGGSG
jgi:phenylpropionate dioxygenase-like ring-hydroxylating dioxygenase large terminal subunit